MSLVTYILQSCDRSLKYRITFDVPTYLEIGETWNVTCSGIQNGCYQVLENVDENLETFNGDECIFTEYSNCEECENNNYRENISETTELIDGLIWDRCDGSTDKIYTLSGITYPSTVYFNGNCYSQTSPPQYSAVTTTDDISGSDFYNKCSVCLGTNPSNTPTPSNTVTPSVTQTPSNTATPSVTQTPSNTATPSVTQTPSNTATPSVTQTPSNTATPSVTQTPSNTATPSVTETPSNTATPSVTQTPDASPTSTPTQTPSNTATPSVTQTPSNTATPSVTQTPSNTATPSVTQTPDASPTSTPTQTPSNTATPSVTQTPSNTVTPSVTQTPSNTATPSVTQTPSNTVTPSVTQTPTLTPTPSIEIPDCVSGTTTGNYRFTDCCGVLQVGSSIGQTFCVDTSLYYGGITPTSLECIVNCDEGPLQILYTVLPDCDGKGGLEIDITGGTKPYTVENVVPGNIQTEQGNGPFNYSPLSGGTYIFNIYDSTFPTARQESIQIIVPNCLNVTITGSSVSCVSNTGTITLSGDSLSFPYTYELYYNGQLFETQTDVVNTIDFTDNILAGDYYGIIIDGVGQTATTTTYTVTSNQGSVDFGYSVTGSSPCISTNNGYAELTGITGTPPFTYQWSNGQTTQSANNLPSGNVSVTVTDSNGCLKTENIVIPDLPKLGISSYTSTQPQCFGCDGTITITASGGTSPYYFSGSTGQIQSYESDTFTLTGLCGGAYSISIQDSAQCNLVQNYQLNSTAGFTIVSINTYNSECGSDGSIEIKIDGVVGLVTYTLTGSSGDVQTTTTSNHTHTFNNLSSDTYIVGVESQSGCKYTTEKIISNEDKFTVSNSSTGTTCGLNNGNVLIEVSSGTTEIVYPLSYTVSRISDGFIVFSNVISTNPTQLVSNLTHGTYEITVTDNDSCSVNSYVTISEDSESINAILYGTPCVLGSDGTATLQITSGQAPFTIQWSDNVPESQRNNYEISGLSGDTYTVTITSNDGCELIKNVTIQCNTENVDDYIINTLCEQDFETTSQGIRGFHEMLNEAFLDLNIPGSNCELVSATFKGVLTISGGSYGVGQTVENEFYTGYTLNDYPTNEEWETVVDGLLSQFTGITFTTNIIDNIFTIQGICDGDQDPTNGAFVELRVEISLDVQCDGSRVLPTPSVTPSITSTPSITPSVTLTPGVSPTQTPTITPSNTPPVINCELVVIGSSKQLSCNLEIDYSITTLNCNLIVSGNYTIQ